MKLSRIQTLRALFQGIQQFVKQVLLTSQNVSYEFDYDATNNRYTLGSLFAYPKTSSYNSIAPKEYGDIM